MNRWLTLGVCLAFAGAYAAPATGDLASSEELYKQLKNDGQAIPAWLNDQINLPGDGSRVGGDTDADAATIPYDLVNPFTDSGTTVGLSDYTTVIGLVAPGQWSCPTTTGNTAPDAWYAFTVPAGPQWASVTASLCGSSFDTKVYIVDAGLSLVAGNDDAPCLAASLQSEVTCCVEPGDYFIVADGYSSNSGTYALTVTFEECSPWVDPCVLYAQNTVALTAPDAVAGSTVGEPNVYGGAAGDAGIDVTIPYAGDWNFDACSANTDFAADLYLFNASPCDGGTLITSNTYGTCVAPGVAGTGRILNVGLAAGVYHLLVGHTSTTEGAFEVSVYETTPPRATAGGPDGYGYAWRNSLDAEGPAYDWVDITAVGTPITFSGGDSYAGPFDIGMNFDFYGTSFSQFYASSDGFLSFNALTSSYYSNQNMPSTSLPQNIVAGFWDDLYWTAGVGQAYYYYDADNGRLIVEYSNFTKSSQFVTFEIILESDGSIQVQYENVPEGYTNSMTLGIENSGGTVGMLVNYNNAGGGIYAGTATRFAIPETDEFGPLIVHTALGSSEFEGPFPVVAQITDAQSGVDGADLFYQVDGGGYHSVAMVAGTPPDYSAEIPAQPLGSAIDYYIVATDLAFPANATTSPTWSFSVQDWTAAPQNVVASDDQIGHVVVTWEAPQWVNVPAPVLGDEPVFEDFLAVESSKDAAWQAWSEAHAAWLASGDAGRSFLTYVVHRDADSLGATTGLTFTDNVAPGTYDYSVTALFDAGESDAGVDSGTALPRVSSGGPDALGYTWVNSEDPSGAIAFDWFEIGEGLGTEIAALTNQDDAYTSIALPRTLSIYGTNYSSLTVSTNGWLSFAAQTSSYLSNYAIPTASAPNSMIAPFWDDLDLADASGTLGHVYSYDDAANGRFVVQFDDVPHFSGSPDAPRYTFEVLLYDDGDIVMQYQTMAGILNSATVGIENGDGTVGLQVNYNDEGGSLAGGTAILFAPPVGDFDPPQIVHAGLNDIETELAGDYAVDATVTDESGLLSVDLVYDAGAGDVTVAMTNAGGDLWTADIPHQPAGTAVSYYITATDAGPNSVVGTSATFGFDVVSIAWPPQNVVASDGAYGQTTVTWSSPAAPAASRPAGLDDPSLSSKERDRLESEWQAEEAGSSRAFQAYRVLRDAVECGVVTGLVFYDTAANGAVAGVEYTYTVQAMYDAGDSPASDGDLGSFLARPTSGGPDAFGYSWINSDDAAGPAYEWIDILGDPNTYALPLTDDSFGGAAQPMGIAFPFYGTDYSEIFVSSNGHLTFGAGSTSLSNVAIPTAGAPDNLIAPFWDDLNPVDTDRLDSVRVLDDFANGRFIVTYNGIPAYSGSVPLIFQTVLYADGTIRVNYQDMDEADVDEATVGVENADGTDGLQVNFDDVGGRIGDGVSLLITVAGGNDCAAPANVGIAIGNGNAILTWDAVAGATDYKVFVAQEAYGAYTELTASTAGAPTWTHTGVLPLVHRYYKVLAICPDVQ